MLVDDPSQLRVRLELARALFSRGNCIRPPTNLVKHLLGDDCWAVEQHFLRVLGADYRRRSSSMSGASSKFVVPASVRPEA